MSEKQITGEKKILIDLLKVADIQINGSRPFDILVKDERLFHEVMTRGALGLGEAYMDGWWDAGSLDGFFDRALCAGLEARIRRPAFMFQVIKAKVLNLQNKERSRKVAEVHYDLSNHLYEKMLDPYMQYTCAYYRNSGHLNQAQLDKLDLICRKLQLRESDTVLELGCGWGGFARFAAENYGCRVEAYNISKEQVAWAREKCRGLPVEFHLQDYREARGTYDKVVSIGLAEHIGHKNYRGFMQIINARLKKRGLALVHTIGMNKSQVVTDAWLDKYIFPGSRIPSPAQMAGAFDGLMVLEDWHNFGPDYDRTLTAWFENFNRNWDSIRSEGLDDRFYRMWKYYLLVCAASFRSRKNQLWQLVLSKNGIPGGYTSVR